MDIRCKRVYQAAQPDDGLRVLVDRIWPRGMTREQVQADQWLKEIAPSSSLRRWFGHDRGRWDEFRPRYLLELDAHPERVEPLRADAAQGRVTLLYAARDTECNHAVALRDYLLAQPVSQMDAREPGTKNPSAPTS